MSFPSSLPFNSKSPWRTRSGWTKRVHETNQGGPLHISVSVNAPGLHNLAKESHEFPVEAIQYAPPLAAYSASHCGLSIASAEYNRALQMMSFTGVRDIPILTPQILHRLDNLRQIRNMGYDLLAPIGINRTMRDLDEEAHIAEDDAESPAGHAENLLTTGTHQAIDPLTLALLNGVSMTTSSAANVSAPEISLPANDLLPEADLDARIPDADVDDLSGDESAPVSDGYTPDAFMAEDVEYQSDHSLLQDSAVAINSLTESHTSFSTGTVLSGPNLATFPTSINPTPVTSNSRVCDDSDIDMTLE